MNSYFFEKICKTDSLEQLFLIIEEYENYAKESFINKFKESLLTLKENREIVVFGAGRYGKEISEDLISLNNSPKYIAEGLEQRIGKRCEIGGESYSIISVEHMISMKDNIIVLISIGLSAKIIEILEENTIPYCFYDIGNFWGYIPEPIICKEKEQLTLVYKELKDDFSRKVLLNMLIARIFPQLSSSMCGSMFTREVVTGPQYFDKKYFRYQEGETFVDCGAYDGDNTIEFFKTMMQLHIKEAGAIVLEPDPKNFKVTQHNIQRLGIQHVDYIQAGVGSKSNLEKNQIFNCYGGESAFTKEIAICNIDDVINAYYKSKLFFIKIDIEGFERDAILGAKSTLKNLKPKLAIAIYHYGKDLYELQLLIKEINPNYQFFIRQHMASTLFETILYCY